MATGPPPDYYGILEASETATTQQIRDAYKRAALKTHPDRVTNDSPERAERTRKFQLVNDAYFTLSDPTRRRDYDAQRKLFNGNKSSKADPFADPEEEEIPTAGAPGGGGGMPGAYSWAWDYFTNNKSGGAANAEGRQQQEDAQFEDVFEEMMREQGMAEEANNRPTGKFWSMVGGVSGGALGFIVANVPGMVAGAVAGNRLGSVRDTKGKSVWTVFQELPQNDKARILSQLAARIFSHAVGV